MRHYARILINFRTRLRLVRVHVRFGVSVVNVYNVFFAA